MLPTMVSELKCCVAGVVLVSLVICSSNAIPVSGSGAESRAFQTVVRRLLEDPEARMMLQEPLKPEIGYRELNKFDLPVRTRRGSDHVLRGMGLVPISSLRRQYEEELLRREQARQNQKNQEFFDTTG